VKRPHDCKRIHFSLDGTIELIRQIPPSITRSGDTASGADEDDAEMFLWRCNITAAGVQWEVVESWTEERARVYVQECDLLCVVRGDSVEMPAGRSLH